MKVEFLSQDVRARKTIRTAENLIILAVSLSLFGGRWISYIGLPSYHLFLVDILYFSGIFWLTCFQKTRNAFRSTFATTFTLSLFVFFQLLRNTDYSLITRLRDLIPYLYFFCTAVVVKKFPQEAWIRTIKSVRAATLLGAIWNDLVMLGLLHHINAPHQFAEVPIFSAKWDHAGFSICIGILLWGAFPKAKLFENVPIQLFLAFSILLQYSRASYVGLFFTLLCIFFANWRRRYEKSNYKARFLKTFLMLIMVSIPFLAFIAPLFPENSAVSRIGVENVFSPSKVIQDTRNSGTASARIEAQKLLTDWLRKNDLEFYGAGPGREMIFESNAYRYLSGAIDVRSPHSWLYGNLGRYGLLGLFLWHYLCFTYLRAQKKRLLFFQFPKNILIPIYVIALFGVILEAPFGMLPFSFFLGGAHLLTLSSQE